MELRRGMRGSLSDMINVNEPMIITMTVTGNAVYDHTCFGVDENNKLSDDRYMIFYNQTVSPNNEISYDMSGNTSRFIVTLGKLPASVNKLVFTINIDGTQTMGMMTKTEFCLFQQNRNALNIVLSGKDFKSEKAVILIELYRKNGIWRYNCVASGFNGGLSDLLRYYGGTEVSADDTPQTNVQPHTSGNSIPIQTNAPSAHAKTVTANAPVMMQNNNVQKQPAGYSVPVTLFSGPVSCSLPAQDHPEETAAHRSATRAERHGHHHRHTAADTFPPGDTVPSWRGCPASWRGIRYCRA